MCLQAQLNLYLGPSILVLGLDGWAYLVNGSMKNTAFDQGL